MKKILFFAMALSILLGCKKTSYVEKFDKLPQERAAEQISLVSNALVASTNGWIATLPTQAGGGYGFYMNFENPLDVLMYGDITATSASVSEKSYYRVKQDLGTELVFDTYNYISLLNDPNGTLGGAAKIGYSSDVEFTFDKISGDTMIFVGKKFRQPFRLVKATAAQKASYLAGGLKPSVDKLTAFFANTKFPYIELGTGATMVKVGVVANFTNNLASGKRLELTALKDNVVTSAKGKFAIGLDGMSILSGGLTYQGISFVKTAWKDATTLALYDSAGKEYIIKSNPIPLTPLYLSFGFPTAFPYKRIAIAGSGLPAGVTSGFTAVYNQMRALFVSSNRSVTSTNFILTSNSILTVEVNYLSGTTNFVAGATYNYTKVGDLITLDNMPIATANWNTRAIQIKPLSDYMLTGPFKIDWVTSTDPNAGTLGGLYRTADPSSFIYGIMQ